MMHRRTLVSFATAIGLALALATTAFAMGGAPRVTTMSGAEEAPGPGDPDGSGFASVFLNVGQATVCWEYTTSNIATPYTGAHIHRAAAGSPGPVVVPLRAGGTGPWLESGCRENVDPALIQEIIDFPERFYVNVHTVEFPAGAIRGQLSNRGLSE